MTPLRQTDAEDMQLHIRGGKGNKDRYVPLPPRTLTLLRAHWRTHRNPVWLFPSPGALGDQRQARPRRWTRAASRKPSSVPCRRSA